MKRRGVTIVRDDCRTLALAHNGNLINAVELYTELRDQGVEFASTSDSEIIAALLALHPAERIEDAVADVVSRLQGAFSTVALTDEAVIAFRDPYGLRPLALGVIDSSADDGDDRPPGYCIEELCRPVEAGASGSAEHACDRFDRHKGAAYVASTIFKMRLDRM